MYFFSIFPSIFLLISKILCTFAELPRKIWKTFCNPILFPSPTSPTASLTSASATIPQPQCRHPHLHCLKESPFLQNTKYKITKTHNFNTTFWLATVCKALSIGNPSQMKNEVGWWIPRLNRGIHQKQNKGWACCCRRNSILLCFMHLYYKKLARIDFSL